MARIFMRFSGGKKKALTPSYDDEFEQDNNWECIEKFAEYTGGTNDIWYAANIEIYDYIVAYRKMIFSMNESSVYNPTALKISFEIEGKSIQIGLGET